MIKIKQDNVQIEIGDIEIKANESLSISIDEREIVFSNIIEEKEDEEEEDEEDNESSSGSETKVESGKGENNKGKKGQGRAKQYTEEKLFEDLLEKCFELNRFPRTIDIQHEDNMASQHTYHARLGSLSNVVDKLGYKLKNEEITEKMRELVVDFCKQHDVEPSGGNMWKVLVENQKKYRKNHPRGANILKKLNR